jgi:hypothetical protein
MARGARTFAALWDAQAGKCYYCECRMSSKPIHRQFAPFGATFDHIVPLSKNGAPGLSVNLQQRTRRPGCPLVHARKARGALMKSWSEWFANSVKDRREAPEQKAGSHIPEPRRKDAERGN